MDTITEEEKNVLVTLLQRALGGGETEVYLNDRRWFDDKKKPDIVIPSDKHDRIQMIQEVGDKLTGLGYLSYDDRNRRWKIDDEGIRLVLPEVDFEPMDVEACLDETLSRAVFHPLPEDSEYPGETPIPWIYVPGTSRLVLVLGENAGGKSFFRRVLKIVTHRGRKGRGFGDRDIPRGPFPVQEMMHISMQGRTQMGAMASLVYGSEDWRSTGENSASTVHMGIKSSTERGQTNIMYWDEPDIGMSAGTAAGAGQAIREFVENANPLVQMVCVTSHSPALVQQLRDLDPHYIYLGNSDGPATLDAWFEYQVNPKPVTPRELMDASHRRFKMIQKVLKG